MKRFTSIGDLFAGAAPSKSDERLAEGAVILRGFAQPETAALFAAVDEIAAAAPFRHMVTPGGFRMSVAMTSCGDTGWVTDRSGYRYSQQDPASGRPWPPMPPIFRSLAGRAAGAGGFCWICSRRLPDQPLRARHKAVIAPRRGRARPGRTGGIGFARIAGNFSVGRPIAEAIGSDASGWKAATSSCGVVPPASSITASQSLPKASIR